MRTIVLCSMLPLGLALVRMPENGAAGQEQASTAQTGDHYYALAYLTKKVKTCLSGDGQLITHQEIPIPAGRRYADHLKDFSDAFRAAKEGPDVTDLEARLVRPGQAVIVYSYTKKYAGWNCQARLYGSAVGDGPREANEKFEANKKWCGASCSDYVEVER